MKRFIIIYVSPTVVYIPCFGRCWAVVEDEESAVETGSEWSHKWEPGESNDVPEVLGCFKKVCVMLLKNEGKVFDNLHYQDMVMSI